MNRLFRSNTNKVLGGLCAGLGDYFDIDPVIVRIILLLLTFVGGLSILFYIIGWIIVPLKR